MSEPEIPQKIPYVVEVEAGKYAWCACGKSQSQPFCDGSHAGSEFSPVITEIEETRKVAWCGCKHSKSAPFCDGTHNHLDDA